jgi:hypothetical protein
MKRALSAFAGTFALAFLLSACSAGAATPSPCKGLDETACGANSECTWIKSKKGKKDYCKKAPAKKAPAKKTPAQPKS